MEESELLAFLEEQPVVYAMLAPAYTTERNLLYRRLKKLVEEGKVAFLSSNGAQNDGYERIFYALHKRYWLVFTKDLDGEYHVYYSRKEVRKRAGLVILSDCFELVRKDGRSFWHDHFKPFRISFSILKENVRRIV